MSDEEVVKRLRELRNNQYADPSTAPEFVFLDPDLPPSEWEKQYSMDVVYVRADLYEALERERDKHEALALLNLQENATHIARAEAARADAKEAEAYAEELEKELNICRMAQVVMENGIAEAEKERDDYAFKLADANNTYSEMHVALSEANDKLAKAMELLKEARQDLEEYVTHEWPKDEHPVYERKWSRDMELCRRIDATLAEIEGEKP